MTESEYNIARTTDTLYHERTSLQRIEDWQTLESVISSRHIITGGQNTPTDPQVPPGGKPRIPGQER